MAEKKNIKISIRFYKFNFFKKKLEVHWCLFNKPSSQKKDMTKIFRNKLKTSMI